MMDANPFPTSNTDLGIISTKAIFGHRVVDFAFFINIGLENWCQEWRQLKISGSQTILDSHLQSQLAVVRMPPMHGDFYADDCLNCKCRLTNTQEQ